VHDWKSSKQAHGGQAAALPPTCDRQRAAGRLRRAVYQRDGQWRASFFETKAAVCEGAPLQEVQRAGSVVGGEGHWLVGAGWCGAGWWAGAPIACIECCLEWDRGVESWEQQARQGADAVSLMQWVDTVMCQYSAKPINWKQCSGPAPCWTCRVAPRAAAHLQQRHLPPAGKGQLQVLQRAAHQLPRQQRAQPPPAGARARRRPRQQEPRWSASSVGSLSCAAN
jgi:hypothetical protein